MKPAAPVTSMRTRSSYAEAQSASFPSCACTPFVRDRSPCDVPAAPRSGRGAGAPLHSGRARRERLRGRTPHTPHRAGRSHLATAALEPRAGPRPRSCLARAVASHDPSARCRFEQAVVAAAAEAAAVAAEAALEEGEAAAEEEAAAGG